VKHLSKANIHWLENKGTNHTDVAAVVLLLFFAPMINIRTHALLFFLPKAKRVKFSISALCFVFSSKLCDGIFCAGNFAAQIK
jgi:hypothetical protein